ncbi:hypothetical protein Lal_00023535 [Lupinus albus]|nr:hypothetical protein Lal_00023535 [Lupinus albus]
MFGCNFGEEKEENKKLKSDSMTSKSSKKVQGTMVEGDKILGVQPQSLIHKNANFDVDFGEAQYSTKRGEVNFMHLLGIPQCVRSKPSLQSSLCDGHNSLRRSQNESMEELDLTLKL